MGRMQPKNTEKQADCTIGCLFHTHKVPRCVCGAHHVFSVTLESRETTSETDMGISLLIYNFFGLQKSTKIYKKLQKTTKNYKNLQNSTKTHKHRVRRPRNRPGTLPRPVGASGGPCGSEQRGSVVCSGLFLSRGSVSAYKKLQKATKLNKIQRKLNQNTLAESVLGQNPTTSCARVRETPRPRTHVFSVF